MTQDDKENNVHSILISFLVLEFVSSMILTAICCMKVYHGEVDFGFVLAALLAVGAIAILAFINKFAITNLLRKLVAVLQMQLRKLAVRCLHS